MDREDTSSRLAAGGRVIDVGRPDGPDRRGRRPAPPGCRPGLSPGHSDPTCSGNLPPICLVTKQHLNIVAVVRYRGRQLYSARSSLSTRFRVSGTLARPRGRLSSRRTDTPHPDGTPAPSHAQLPAAGVPVHLSPLTTPGISRERSPTGFVFSVTGWRVSPSRTSSRLASVVGCVSFFPS